MNKTVKKVFMLIAVLVVIFIAWQLVFGDGGILKVGYNAIVNGINGQWAKVAGKGQSLLPTWETTGASDNGQGFDIKTE